jgi:hypothetical protein
MAADAKTDLRAGKAGAASSYRGSLLLIFILVAIAAAVGISRFGVTPTIEPDSESYINASGIRTLGYPFFLACMR